MKELKEYLCKKNISFALLFGSYARGDSHFLSDIDIGVWFKKEPDILDIGQIVGDLEEICQKRVDFVVLNELYKKNPLLSYNIASKHKILCLKDKECYIDFKRQSYLCLLIFKN